MMYCSPVLMSLASVGPVEKCCSPAVEVVMLLFVARHLRRLYIQCLTSDSATRGLGVRGSVSRYSGLGRRGRRRQRSSRRGRRGRRRRRSSRLDLLYSAIPARTEGTPVPIAIKVNSTALHQHFVKVVEFWLELIDGKLKMHIVRSGSLLLCR